MIDTGQMKIAKSNKIINLLQARNQSTPYRHKPQVPPPCQVEAQEKLTTVKGKGAITFDIPITKKHTRHHNLQHRFAKRKARRRSSTFEKATQRLEAVERAHDRALEKLENSIEQLETANAVEEDDIEVEDENIEGLQKELAAFERSLREGMASGAIPSAIVDSGTTSNVGMPEDPFIDTNLRSNKVFAVANGQIEQATTIKKLHHDVREPARTVDIVPGVTTATLISTAASLLMQNTSQCLMRRKLTSAMQTTQSSPSAEEPFSKGGGSKMDFGGYH